MKKNTTVICLINCQFLKERVQTSIGACTVRTVFFTDKLAVNNLSLGICRIVGTVTLVYIQIRSNHFIVLCICSDYLEEYLKLYYRIFYQG